MAKLFKKLSEQLKTKSITSKSISEDEIISIEKKVIYEDFVSETKDKIESASN